MEIQHPVEHYTAERIPNPNPQGEVSWQLYHTVRNAVLRCCGDFGRSGPMGECPITKDEELPYKLWHVAEPLETLDFFVVDDQYNDERYVYVEVCRPPALTAAWLRALMSCLGQFEGWGAGINFTPDAYILAFADRLMVTGGVLAGSQNLDSVAHLGRAQFEKNYAAKNAK